MCNHFMVLIRNFFLEKVKDRQFLFCDNLKLDGTLPGNDIFENSFLRRIGHQILTEQCVKIFAGIPGV